MEHQKTKIIAYDSDGNIIYTAVTRVNIFTQLILNDLYYTEVKGCNKNAQMCVCAFNAKHINRVLDIITTDPYYTCCRHCERFRQCLTFEYRGECDRGLIGGVF